MLSPISTSRSKHLANQEQQNLQPGKVVLPRPWRGRETARKDKGQNRQELAGQDTGEDRQEEHSPPQPLELMSLHQLAQNP